MIGPSCLGHEAGRDAACPRGGGDLGRPLASACIVVTAAGARA